LIGQSLVPLVVLWLLLVAFLRIRPESGSWLLGYRVLYAAAWRNRLKLLDAFVSTGLLWLVLLLWCQLCSTWTITLDKELLVLTPCT